MAPASAPRAIWLLARLKLLRLRNQTALIGRRLQKAGASRQASAGKKRGGWLVAALIVSLMLFGFYNMAIQAVRNLHCRLDGVVCPKGEAAQRTVADLIAAAPFSPAVTGGLTLMLGLLVLVSFLIQVSNREAAGQDSDLEWLVTLPFSRTWLLLARLCERSLTNAAGWLAFTPLCLAIAWDSGLRWSAPLLAVGFALPLLLLAALCWTLIDTGLRLSLAPSAMRNLQALLSVLVTPLMLVPLSFGASVPIAFQFAWARALPAWMAWSPPGLVVQAINAHDLSRALVLTALLLGQVALLVVLGLGVLRYQLRHGVVASGARESGRAHSASGRATMPTLVQEAGQAAQSGQAAMAAPRPAAPSGAGGLFARLSAVQRRELRLLGRDRNFLMQSLVVPIVILASQLLFNGHIGNIAELAARPGLMAAVAFGLGVQVLMMSAMATLNREGGALWLLFTFPLPIEQVLKEKAQLWAVLSLAYACCVLLAGLWAAPSAHGWHSVGLLLLVLLGMPIYAFIAVALGVFAADPQAQDARMRLRPTYVYLYMLLSSLYVYGLVAGRWWHGPVIVVLVATLAYALWQKARDQLPYLLDPQVAPPARVSASDGLIAATLFFVLQGLFGLLSGSGSGAPDMAEVVMAFAGAGLLTYLLMRYSYWRNKTQGVPTVLGPPGGRAAAAGAALRWGCALGAAVAVAGLAYLYLLRHVDLGQGALPAVPLVKAARLWLLALTVLAAPLCEEFIFRGLIFGGLRRSMGAWPAIFGSAAIFAVVHPPLAMLPVFMVGIVAGLAYERSKVLLAPMLVHAIYNAAVVASQLFF